MSYDLLIIESPNKRKKIAEILGLGFRVSATVGHIRDLPDQEMGIEAPDFRPHYVTTERGREIVGKLKTEARGAGTVYLASDPDREGESIAWHCKEALGLKNEKRVVFHEITEKGITEGMKNPRKIDMKMVAAQETRRVLDRLYGYRVSGPLSRAAQQRLSAGRVQTPAVRRVVERCREIAAFVSTTHFGALLTFAGADGAGDWTAEWAAGSWIAKGERFILDQALAERVAGIRDVEVVSCEEKEKKTAPPPPFITSTLQRAAGNKLGFGTKKTMDVAQKLFAAGHITYLRTDSPTMADDAIAAVRAYCEGKKWPLCPAIRRYKAGGDAQGAHECIRPTHIEIETAGDSDDERALYELIRVRALATQLADAVQSVRVAGLRGELDGKAVEFEARGSTPVSRGWRILLDRDDTNDAVAEADNPVPRLRPGTGLTAKDGRLLTKKTNPPPYFTEASLVEELERLGIGRPATYAAIMSKILDRGYIVSEKKKLKSTHLGELIVDTLAGGFDFIEYDFTRDMEKQLDDIASGKARYLDAVRLSYEGISRQLDAFAKVYPGAVQAPRPTPVLSEFKCLDCEKPLIRKQGQKKDGSGEYDFYGCSGWPKCGATYQVLSDGSPDFDGRKGKKKSSSKNRKK